MKGVRRLTNIINVENASAARTALMKTIQSQPVNLESTKSYLLVKFNDANAFYKHLTGLDELEYYADRVIELQRSLADAQAKRRELSFVLNDVRTKSLDIQERLHKVKRHEDPAHFLELMREETEFIKKERQVFASLTEQERYERDVFTAFTNAIRDSQDKQRNRLEYAKYIGFGLTLFGALGSYLITTWRTQDLKAVIRGGIQEDVREAFAESGRENLRRLEALTSRQVADQTEQLRAALGQLTAEVAETNRRFLRLEADQPRAFHVSDTQWRAIGWAGLGLFGACSLAWFVGGS